MSNYVNDMTNEEIWEMLIPKLNKNGTLIKGARSGLFGPIFYYEEKGVQNAIAIAYRSGYIRAMKGRPFKIGEKKKKSGHWEPVDPNNLPKEGTRVRYAREYAGYIWNKKYLPVGAKGVLTIGGPYDHIGIKLDKPTDFVVWADFEEAIDCLDMWVEDDE